MEKYCESWSCHVPSVTCQEIPVHAHVKLYFRKLVCFLYLILLALKKQSTCDYHASFMMVPVYMVNFTNTSVCEIKFHWVKIFKLQTWHPIGSISFSNEKWRDIKIPFTCTPCHIHRYKALPVHFSIHLTSVEISKNVVVYHMFRSVSDSIRKVFIVWPCNANIWSVSDHQFVNQWSRKQTCFVFGYKWLLERTISIH